MNRVGGRSWGECRVRGSRRRAAAGRRERPPPCGRVWLVQEHALGPTLGVGAGDGGRGGGGGAWVAAPSKTKSIGGAPDERRKSATRSGTAGPGPDGVLGDGGGGGSRAASAFWELPPGLGVDGLR